MSLPSIEERFMDTSEDKNHYSMMLNSLSGLEDDLGANHAPRETLDLIKEIIAICLKDFRDKFPE